MAIATKSSFQIYNEYIHEAISETLTQASDAFNSASSGAINLSSVLRQGDYVYESFFASVASLVTRRTTTGTAATADATDLNLTQGQKVAVKVNRKIGPVANTLDSFKKIQKGPFNEDALNWAIGVQAAKAMQVNMLNTALYAARAALNNQSSVKYTVTSSGTLSNIGLVNGLAKFGDNAGLIICWVMHSKPFYDLVGAQITANILGVTDFVLGAATPVTLGRPVLVTDSAALFITAGSPSVTTYYTMGLTQAAIECEDSEETTMFSDMITGKENLFVRFQGEFAFNVALKGFAYDVTSGGENPSDSTIATGANWDPYAASYKGYAGVIILST
jgi:hypothetical protein